MYVRVFVCVHVYCIVRMCVRVYWVNESLQTLYYQIGDVGLRREYDVGYVVDGGAVVRGLVRFSGVGEMEHGGVRVSGAALVEGH